MWIISLGLLTHKQYRAPFVRLLGLGKNKTEGRNARKIISWHELSLSRLMTDATTTPHCSQPVRPLAVGDTLTQKFLGDEILKHFIII